MIIVISRCVIVPVVVIFTEFDAYIESIERKSMESSMKSSKDGMEIIVKQDKALAIESFEKDYKAVLMNMAQPPAAIVAVSNSK